VEESDFSNDTEIANEPQRRPVKRSESGVFKDKMTGLQSKKHPNGTHHDYMKFMDSVNQIFNEIKPRVKTHSFFVENMKDSYSLIDKQSSSFD